MLLICYECFHLVVSVARRNTAEPEIDKRHWRRPSSFDNESRMASLEMDVRLCSFCVSMCCPSPVLLENTCELYSRWVCFAFALESLTFCVTSCLRTQIERRMELVRLVSHNTHKRLVSCLQGQLGTDTEKRHVRSTLWIGVGGEKTSSYHLAVLATCYNVSNKMLVLHVAHTEIKRGSITVITLSVLARTCYLVLWTHCISSYVTHWYERKYSALASCQLHSHCVTDPPQPHTHNIKLTNLRGKHGICRCMFWFACS